MEKEDNYFQIKLSKKQKNFLLEKFLLEENSQTQKAINNFLENINKILCENKETDKDKNIENIQEAFKNIKILISENNNTIDEKNEKNEINEEKKEEAKKNNFTFLDILEDIKSQALNILNNN
jgi:hypothetical protein